MLNKTFLLMLFSIVSSYGQITTTKVPQKVEIADEKPYDGSKNFLGKDVRKYIGEELYVKGKKDYLRSSGYKGFYLDYNHRRINDKSNIYKVDNFYSSSYNDLQGKYFLVLDVIEHPESLTFSFYKNNFFLKLEEKESKDVVYYLYNSENDFSFPFITIKYFLKIKSDNIGNKFVLRGKNWESPTNSIIDIKSGNPVKNFSSGGIWTCIDVSIDERDSNISLVLENTSKEQILLEVNTSRNNDFVFNYEQAELYKKKFGSEKWAKIVDGKVSIGMTKEMCEVSWGKPQYINKTITANNSSEQWVYSDNYLYFDKGILTAMQ